MKKRFDCVEMKQKAQEEIMKRLKGLSPEKQLEYWQKRHEELEKERAKRLARKAVKA